MTHNIAVAHVHVHTTPHTTKGKMAEETRDDEEPLIQNESSVDDGEDEGDEDDGQQKDNFLDVIGNFGVYQLGSNFCP